MFWRQHELLDGTTNILAADLVVVVAVGNAKNAFEKSRQVEMKTDSDIVLSKVYDEKEDRKREMNMTDIGKYQTKKYRFLLH